MNNGNSSLGVGWGVLTQKRLQVITETLNRQQKLDRQFTFLKRTPINEAGSDAELLGEFQGEIYAADIVMPDQAATVHDIGKFTSFNQEIANLKHGILLGQKQLDELENYRLRGDGASRFMNNWINRRIADLLLGVRMRLEAMIVACYRDNAVYDRYGVKIRGSWGTPSQLKFAVAVPWNNHADADPVGDIQLYMGEIAPDNEAGFVDAPVLSMSRKAYNHMVSCAKFWDRAKIENFGGYALNWDFPVGATPNPYEPRVQLLAEQILKVRIEFYETNTNVKNDDGSTTKSRNLPHDEILVHGPNVWGNSQVLDVGNGVVTESIVNEIIGSGAIGGINGGRQSGPLSYAAPTTIDMNPPGVTIWTVMRAFPRKFDKTATGLIDIGINPTTGV